MKKYALAFLKKDNESKFFCRNQAVRGFFFRNMLLCILTLSFNIATGQLKLISELQSVENSAGQHFNSYHAEIEFQEPQNVSDNGTVAFYIQEIGGRLTYQFKFLKRTFNEDGVIFWYAIINNESRGMFNIVKLQRFKKPILSGKYTYCVMLSKYSENMVREYEHSYFSTGK